MVMVKKEGVILEPTDLEFENQGVLNPAVVQQGNTLHMFYRAVKKGNYSSIGYCRLDGPLNVVERSKKPIMIPEFDYEKHSIEDPRIVFLDGIYYLFYVAYDGKNALTAYATSKDLKQWEKQGIISPKITYDEAEDIFRSSKLKERYSFFESYYRDVVAPDVLLWEKDAFIFPKKFNNKFALIHRILPDIQVIYFNDFKALTLDYWKEYLKKLGDFVVLEPKHGYESRNIGGGAPVINTDKGWLMIYHSVEDSNNGKIYRASVALLDKKDPCKVIGRLNNPLFSPEEEYEKLGDVNNVVFPTGTAIFKGRLYIYYGAADKRVAVASVNLNELLEELLATKIDFDAEIGFIAGQIFNLGLKKEVTLTQLKDTLKKDEKTILMAIGWLAKDNKVQFRHNKDEIKIKTK
ncbi:MAG: winged helix-turn-helix domain-containing protein [Nanoarchaeota archaeon]|nr:winged helix-turn-helix domain-containing protein [Nanoarchaeota archaeon]MBU1322169.1 winged helix-turn-helix domain-containing protein [Nanoarchaeota archaeon]MBU1597710.1 winged helix-turn-helix domain-containing protein [Nanoarchaeota archaeon]MBU2442188.1 winged helix-turn-helix domain-containing protein [Nanoarchaeota archaeon]